MYQRRTRVTDEVSLQQVDEEDRDHLRGKDVNYVRGWNQVKRRNAKCRKRWGKLDGEELIE